MMILEHEDVTFEASRLLPVVLLHYNMEDICFMYQNINILA